MRQTLRSVSVLGVFLFSVTSIWAQSERGTIRGTITDASQAAVVGATVVAVNESTGVRSQTLTGDAGNYQISQVPAGTYTVEVEMKGFRKLIREKIRVGVSQVVGLDLPLEVGDVAETVTVSDTTVQLKTENTEVSTEVNPKSFIDLPLQVQGGSGRSVENFIFLAPGTSGNTFDAHINGSQTLSKEIQMDGLSMTTAEVGGDPRVILLPPEAVQEFSLVTSSYSAEFGNTGGGVERLVVRSGTNDFHGNAYEFLRNDKLDARGFFNADRSVQRRNEFGFTLNGPIYIPKVYNGKNRSFWFTNWHWYKFRSGTINQLASVPTQAFRNGDLSELKTPAGALIQLYDPASTRQEGGVFVRDPFANNRIPAARLSRISQNILGYVPLPGLPGITNNFAAAGNSRNDNRNVTNKINHNFTEAHRLSGMWNWAINQDNGPFAPLPRPVANSRDGVKGPEANAVRIAYDWVISPTMLNHFNIGMTRQFQLLAAPEQGQGYAEKVGLKGVFNGPFPHVEIPPFTAYGLNQDLLQTVSTTYLLSDGVTLIRGKHNYKFGIEVRRMHNNFSQGARSGDWNFARNQTASPTALNTTGDAFASFLLGEVSSGALLINQVTKGMRLTYFGAYLQDDYKVTPRLTLNLGMRWDLFTPMVEVNDKMSIMDPDLPNPRAGGYRGALVFAGDCQGCTGSRRLTDARETSLNNWGPRLGLAWSATNKLVLRTAYGISYFPSGPLGGGNSKPPSPGFTTNLLKNSLDGVNAGMNWENGFPINEFTLPPFIDPGFGTGLSIEFWNKGGAEPQYTQSFNSGLQYQIAPTWMLDVSWVGQKSNRLSTGVFNPQQVHPQYLRLGELLRLPITDPRVAAAGFSPPYAGFTGPLNQALRQFPQYQGLNLTRSDNVGNSMYHSLQVKLEREFTDGLWVLSSYTWAKTLTDASSSLSSFFSTTARDHYNRGQEKALAVYDIPHRFVAAINYELPIGPGKSVANVHGVVGKILQGWQVNAILSYQSAEPIGIGTANTLPLFNSRNLPNAIDGANPYLADKSKFDPAKDLLLDPRAFVDPAPFTFGNAASILPNARVFNNFNEDFGIMKRTSIWEQVNIEFRFELFNVFNRVRFAGPATTLSDPFNYGKVTSQANAPRSGQVALKLNF